MDERVFNAMLKTALEEALRQDMEAAPAPPQPSRRQRVRMRRLLNGRKGEAGWSRCPVRWLAAVAAAALVTGAAAGYAMGGGARFRQMFDESPWAKVYGCAADTEQLLKMGGQLDTLVVEANGLRFQLLDAVSDGQLAMVSARMTVLEKTDVLREDPGGIGFLESDIVPASGGRVPSYGFSIRSWLADSELEEGEYLLIFTINDSGLAQGGRYEIRLRDLCAGIGGEPLLSGSWTLAVTLRPAGLLELRPERVCTMGGTDWLLERMALSPLALSMDFRALEAAEWKEKGFLELSEALQNTVIHMKDGHALRREDYTTGLSGSPEAVSLTIEFQMPINMGQAERITVCGQDIVLENG